MPGHTRARILLAALALTGCFSVRIDTDPPRPAAPPPHKDFLAHVEFDGNPEFLPQSLVRAPDGESAAPFVRYSYQSTYYPAVGDTRLQSDVVAQGFLEIERAGASHTWTEQCKVTMYHWTFNFDRPTASELRAQALRCVRDLFDARLAGRK